VDARHTCFHQGKSRADINRSLMAAARLDEAEAMLAAESFMESGRKGEAEGIREAESKREAGGAGARVPHAGASVPEEVPEAERSGTASSSKTKLVFGNEALPREMAQAGTASRPIACRPDVGSEIGAAGDGLARQARETESHPSPVGVLPP